MINLFSENYVGWRRFAFVETFDVIADKAVDFIDALFCKGGGGPHKPS